MKEIYTKYFKLLNNTYGGKSIGIGGKYLWLWFSYYEDSKTYFQIGSFSKSVRLRIW